MNDDRCYHVAGSPGQEVCTCLDRRMYLEFLVHLQARRIVELQEAVDRRKPEIIRIGTSPE